VGTTKDFSAAGGSSSHQRIHEIEQVASYLHLDGWHIAFPGDAYHLQLDHMPQQRIIHAIEQGPFLSLEHLRPTILAFPTLDDYNQDHRAAALAAFTACRPNVRARKYTPYLLLSYYTPSYTWSPTHSSGPPNFFVELSEKEMEEKTTAMNIFRSQRREMGNPRNSETLRALATVHGSAIGAPFAEAFFCQRFSG
jgi:LmbE family N-acetylglucosaminyl deacetylase